MTEEEDAGQVLSWGTFYPESLHELIPLEILKGCIHTDLNLKIEILIDG